MSFLDKLFGKKNGQVQHNKKVYKCKHRNCTFKGTVQQLGGHVHVHDKIPEGT